MTYAPILFISAATGQRVPRLLEMINYVHNQSCMRISTGMLNNILADAQTRVQPPTDRGRRLKIYYMTQVASARRTLSCSATSASSSISPTSATLKLHPQRLRTGGYASHHVYSREGG